MPPSLFRFVNSPVQIRLTLSGPVISVVCQAWGGGLRGQDAKNQDQHHPTEMRLDMSHYGHKRIPDAKLESDSSSI